ncbi:MAG: hypothetical protein M5U26_26535 [Planctomycetota bacterium]|nr:hypothetical protein [Planctomycetota bacterium]
MGKTVTIEVPDEIYEVLERKAREEGRPMQDVVVEWMANHLPRKRVSSPEVAERQKRELREYFGAWKGPIDGGSENDSIDRDLAREYGSSHEEDDVPRHVGAVRPAFR